ncbi:MAG: hypothetical protein IKO39_10815, partial [Treponema sp.]|nr:hypothetical protein [Treponema sp.]
MSARKCVMLMAMLACAGGAWGVDWNDDFETQDVTGTETIVLTKDITVTNLWIHTENQAATINLNGHTLTVTKFYLGGIENEANDEVPTTNAILKLIDTSETPGTLKITKLLDVANDKNTQLILANGVSVKITGTYWLNVDTDKGKKTTISGNGIFDVSEGTNGTVSVTWADDVYVSGVVLDDSSVSVVDPSNPTTPTSGVATDTYYWTGTAGDKSWFTSTNWAANTAGTPVKDGTYPGITTENKAIFTGSAEINLNGSITDLTSINTSDSTVTIVSSSSGISLGSASVTFTGNFAFKGSFTASSLATYFLNGNVDFSECSAFNATNSGTVYFFSSSENEKTLTTFSGQAFNNLRFGGNVTIDASAGTLSAAYLGMHANDIEALYQTSSFTSKITGGSVSVTGNLQISRVSSSSSSTAVVIGTLELDNTVLSSDSVSIHPGTEISLTSSSQLTSKSIQQQAAEASYPNAIHNDGRITVTGTPASSLSIFGASEASRFTVDGSGRFVVSGGTSAFTGTYLSIGGDIKISENSGSVAANTFETTASVPATGVTYAQIMANGWKVSSGIFKWTGASSSDWNEVANWVEIIGESTTIAATFPPNSKKHEVTIPSGLSVWPIATESIELNTLSVEDGAQLTLGNSSSTSSLKLYGDSSSQLPIEGKLIFSGTTSLECESLEEMTFKDLQFGSSSGDTSATFTTGVNMVISDGGSWVNYSGSGGFIPNGKSVTFTGSASLSGTTTFADLSFTGSGKTVSFDSDSLINVGGKLTVQGEENNEITFGGDSEWKINPDTSNLSVSHAVIKNSKNTNSSPIVVKAAENTNGGGNTNWIFIGYEYEWTGSSSTDPTDWYTAENWNPQMVPEKYSKITIPQVTSENYPLISKATDLGSGSLVYDGVTYTSSISVAENASFDFNGKKLTVNTLKSDGRMRLLGTEDLTGITNYPLDGSYITGTVEFYGTNLTITDATSGGNFTNLEFTGSGISIKGNFVAKNNILVKTNLTLKGNASFTAANGIEFNSDTALSINQSGTSEYSATFNSPVTASCDLSFTLSSVNFSDSASFSHDSTKSITINSPTAFNFGKAAFNAGKLIIASGASFKQTGINQASDSSELLQTVGDIVNDGSCIWDSSSLGGSLSLNGDLSGTKAAEILFNKKNVTLVKSPVSISGVFYDLTIPDSVEATNSSQICVRRNLSVIGSYIHNDKNLVLGAVTVNGTTYESGENDGGAAGEIYSPSSNLGSVIINQNETGKKFTSEINALSLSMDCILSDSSKTGGSIEFAEKITAESFTNAAATNFALLFDKACSFTNALSPAAFSTTGNLVLGTAEESSCTFASALSHTTGETILAGSLSALSAEFARTFLSKNTVIDCGSGSVTFNGLLDSQLSDSHASIQIGSETSATEAHFAASLGSVNPLLSLTV